MNRKNFLPGILALTLVFAIMAGCDTGDGGTTTKAAETVTYADIGDNGAYTLKITEKVSWYTAKDGDSYVLTFFSSEGTKTTSGTITTVEGSTIKLGGSANNITITITVKGITEISGTVAWVVEEGEATPVTITVTLTPTENKDFLISEGELIKYIGAGGKVTIPDGVTKIRMRAFEDCTSLTSITIPNNVTVIRESAFNGCTSLTSVIIPDSVTSIWN